MEHTFSLISCDSTGRGVRAVLYRLGDRWTHTLEVMVHGWWREAGSSQEGDASHPWPPSPALQSMERSTLPDGRDTLLLVGMAGTSHWSASIEQGMAPGELVFDIACRLSKLPDEPNLIGSVYQRSEEPPIEFASLPGVSDTLIAATGKSVAIRPASLPSRLPGTARWRYRVLCP